MFHATDVATRSVLTAPRVRLALLRDMPPDADVVSALARVDETDLNSDDAITYLQVVERLGSWLAARRNAALVAAAAPEPRIAEFTVLVPDSEEERTLRIADAAREEIAAALRWTPAGAQSQIDTARLLAGPLAATGEALKSGEISPAHVSAIVEHACRLPGHLQGDATEQQEFTESCVAFQRRVLPIASRSTVPRTRGHANRVVMSIDADGVLRRRQEALAARDVYVSDQVDGMSVLIARMATEQAHAILSMLNAHAKAAQGRSDDPGFRSAGERRVDSLTDLVLRKYSRESAAGLRAHLNLVIDLPTLLSLRDDAHACAGVVELRGGGAIPAVAVRDLLADAETEVTLRRLIADPVSGHLLDHGRRTYAVPDALREFIVARDRTCRFPGCSRPADRCQIDHVVAWEDGGATSPGNLGVLCVRHHQLKTHGGWRLSAPKPDGACNWTSPQGRTYEHEPPPF
jgi:hypothetical protein